MGYLPTHLPTYLPNHHPPTQPRPPNHHTTHLKIHPSTNQDMHLGTDRHIHQPITNPSQRATQPDPSTHTLISRMESEASSTMQILSSSKQVDMSGAMGSQTCRYGHASKTAHRKLPCRKNSWRWAHDSLHLPSPLEQH